MARSLSLMAMSWHRIEHLEWFNRLLTPLLFGEGPGEGPTEHFSDLTTNTLGATAHTTPDQSDHYSSYIYDSNGNIMALHRIGDAAPMDELTYTYFATDNRLQHVDDQVIATACSTDVDAMATDFTYYRNGNLQNDPGANIALMLWHPNGKLNAIIREGTNDLPTLIFSYDGLGNRVRKVQVARDASGNTLPMSEWDLTYYIRDAQGNHITTIERDFTDTDEYEATDELNITETVMYGSDRLGTRGWVKSDDGQPATLIGRQAFTHSGAAESGEYTAITPFGTLEYSEAPENYFSSLEGAKHYELKNHLGNVLATVSDKRDVEVDGSNNVESYTAKISDVSFYYPFGSMMPGLSDFGGGHRFGFQGQQKDNEVRNVNGSHIDFKYRPYNSDLGRFWKVDPLFKKYPFYSSYAFSGNRVVDAIELEGLEPQLLKNQILNIKDGQYGRNWGYGGKQGASDKTNWQTVVNDQVVFQVVQCMDCMGPFGERPLLWYKVDEPKDGTYKVVPPVMVKSGTLDSKKPLDETVDRIVNAAKGLLPDLKNKYGQDSENVSSVHVQLPEVLSSQLRGPVKDALKEEFPMAHVSVWGGKDSESTGASPGHGGTAESTPFQVSIQGSPKKEGQ